MLCSHPVVETFPMSLVESLASGKASWSESKTVGDNKTSFNVTVPSGKLAGGNALRFGRSARQRAGGLSRARSSGQGNDEADSDQGFHRSSGVCYLWTSGLSRTECRALERGAKPRLGR